MTKSSIVCYPSVSTIGVSSSTFYPVIQGMVTSLTTNENLAKVKWKYNSTFSNIAINVTVNSHAQSRNFRFRKNGVNGNQLITIGAFMTGWFEDNVNTDSVSVNDQVNSNLQTSTGFGLMIMVSVRYVVAPTDTTKTIMCYGYLHDFGYSHSGTLYGFFTNMYSSNASAIEANTHLKLKTTGTFKYAGCYIRTNSKIDTFTIRSRKNTSNGNIVISIPAGVTGNLYDDSNSDSVSPNDLFNYSLLSLSFSTLTISLLYVFWESTNRTYHLVSAAAVGASLSTPYLAICGFLTKASFSISEFQVESGIPTIISNMRVKFTANQDNTTDLYFTRNSVTQPLGFTNMSSSALEFEDNTNTVAIGATDFMEYRISEVTTTRSAVILSVLVTVLEIPPSTSVPMIIG